MQEESTNELNELLADPVAKKPKKPKIDKKVFDTSELEKIYSTAEGQKFLKKKFAEEKKTQALSDDAAILQRFMDKGNFTKEEAARHLLDNVGMNHFRYAVLFNDTVLTMNRNQIWDIIGKSNVDDIVYAESKR